MTARNIHENSIISYYALDDLEKRQKDVESIVAECPNASALDVYNIMRRRGYQVKKNNVAARLSELEALDRVRVTGRKINRTTGRKASTYEVRSTDINDEEERQ